MKGDHICYRAGYLYQLAETYQLAVGIAPERDIVTEYILLNTSGMLTILRGYAWDGPSGPTVDTRDFMRGSLVHDALYQLMRDGYLDPFYRARADSLLREICLEDGMPPFRAQYVYMGVALCGGPFIDPAAARELLSAP